MDMEDEETNRKNNPFLSPSLNLCPSSSIKTPACSCRASPAKVGRVPRARLPRLWHPGRRWRHPGTGRRDGSMKPIPVFDTVAEARKETGCNATMIFVPPPGAADGILEAADAGHRTHRLHHRGYPRHGHDARQGPRSRALTQGVRLIGPNCPGIITPDQCKIGIMPGYIHKPGTVGVHLAFGHVDLRGRLAIDLAAVWGSRRASASAATPSTARAISTRSNSSRRTRARRRSSSSAKSAARQRKKPPPGSGKTARNRWRRSSPGRPHRPDGAWATRAPLSAAARARQKARSPRWKSRRVLRSQNRPATMADTLIARMKGSA